MKIFENPAMEVVALITEVITSGGVSDTLENPDDV